MIIEKEYLDQLEYFVAIADGPATGVYGTWEMVYELRAGYPNSLNRAFVAGKKAIYYLLFELSFRAKTKKLNLDELETLESCEKLIGIWQKESLARRVAYSA